MISEKRIVRAVDDANVHFLWCWERFQKLKRFEIEPQDLTDFQVRLTAAFTILDRTYRLIKADQKRLIERKEQYSRPWFASRMGKLDLYLKAVKEALGIGRSLGDGFAWIFYKDESALLEQHNTEQRQLLLPPSVGGLGERAFIEKLQGLKGMFVLYHAITSFLRLGDVSFFDPVSGEIVGIGELKTRHVEGDRYDITLGFVSGGFENPMLKQDESEEPDVRFEPLDQSTRKKLNKQMDQLGNALEMRVKADANPRIETSSKFHFEVLERNIQSCGARAFEMRKAGPGLILGAWRPRLQSSLGKRIMRSATNIDAAISPVEAAVAKILDPQLEDNCLFIGNLGNHETGFPVTPSGGVPMIWWPLGEQQIHDLLFGHVLVITLFNPAILWAILRKRGFEVILGRRSRVLKITKKVGKAGLDLENFSYFENLIPYALMDENAVADMIDASVKQIVAAAGGRPAKVGIRPHLRFEPDRRK
ncbi:hypothetical protein [Hoeflea prorocentri]|uniref:Uncharacterized protein n=1 Tax=Hoeflea prorocentri TaxID=1922333 RepID=A0A9X3ZG14_9HYPH|nr:hypothetical protein [Hoeflea prorocentri]MCY6379350.1 hypothetical protein [Hoeflea prorocentri]MDA5397151.1 hypothetical protein [Hoeflea prorocentri]